MSLYEPTKKILTASLVMLVASVVAFVVFGFLIFFKLAAVSQKIVETRNATKGVEQAIVVKGELNEHRLDIETVESFFIKPGGEVEFIEKMESLAEKLSVKTAVENINIEEKSPVKFAEVLDLNVASEGGLEALLLFINSVENMPYSISLNSLTLSSKGQSEVWSARMNLSVYKIKTEEPE